MLITKVTILSTIYPELWKNTLFSNRNYNCDEIGITPVLHPTKIFAEKGQKHVGFVRSWEREKINTGMCAFKATTHVYICKPLAWNGATSSAKW